MITPMLGLAAREGSGEGQGILSVMRQMHHLQHAEALPVLLPAPQGAQSIGLLGCCAGWV